MKVDGFVGWGANPNTVLGFASSPQPTAQCLVREVTA